MDIAEEKPIITGNEYISQVRIYAALGFSKKSLKEIAKKHNDGFYLDLINSLPIETVEKKRLLRDDDIQEAEIIEETGE